ncbi:MAG: rod shape-determining protein RodA [Gammaproteobacteria bacterium]
MKEQSLSERLHVDMPLLFGILVLCAIGLTVLYSAGGQDMSVVYRQGVRILVAVLIMLIVAQIPTMQLSRWSLWIYLFSIALLVLVLMFGHTGKGAQRWLDLGLFRFQPSEVMKLALPMAVAWYLSEKHLPPSLGRIIMSFFMIMIPVVLIVRQPDLGTAVIVAAAGFAVLFISGISWRLIGSLSMLAAMSAPVFWYMMHEYQRQRVLTFLNPEQDPLGTGYHIIQSKIAIGSGGIYGKGWLNGTQSHLEFLPERSTDFIFAVFCEEFGLMGVLLLLCAYSLVICRGLYISAYAQTMFGKLLGAAVVLTFFVYIFVNMGMVSGQLPVVGLPLPLISHGGTSMVTLMAGFGLLMGIHTHRRLLSD